MQVPRIDGERLWRSLEEMAKIGATPEGGCDRQALTDADREARELFRSWCVEAGLSVEIDDMGCMYAHRPGRRSDLPPVALGSHLDTQPNGGRFDGPLGVLAALEVVRTLNDHGIETERGIVVVNWTNEEGCRFAPAMLASGVFAGVFDREWAHDRRDREGRRFGDELERIGYRGAVPCRARNWRCHFELHIEQGPVLESEGRVIGVVTGAQGTRWYDAQLVGRASHAGTTPMDRRRDALAGAAEAMVALERMARAVPDAVATVGTIAALPGSRNVVPGEVRFSVDIRHPDDATADRLEEAFAGELAQIAARRGLGHAFERIWAFPALRFDSECIAAVRAAAEAEGLPFREMVSGAGHDSCYVARVVPTSMIFVPCREGLSHNPGEWCEPEHAAAGCQVLLRAALTMATA